MSERIMMALGEFRFETSAASYQSLSYSQSWRWPEQARLGREPAHQFTGREKTEIKLSGTLYPSFRGGLSSIEALRAIADSGEPQLLVDGLGRVWGSWVILSVNDNRSVLLDDGQPRKIGFDLTLREYGEDDTLDLSGWTPFGAIISITGLFTGGEGDVPPSWGGGTPPGGQGPQVLNPGDEPYFAYADPFTLGSSSLLFGCDPIAAYELTPWTYDEERESVLARAPQLGFQFGEETNWKVKGLISVHITDANGSIFPVPQAIQGINTQTGEIIPTVGFNDCFIEKHVYFTDVSQLLDDLGIYRGYFDAAFN